MRIYEERTKTECKQTNAKKDDNSYRISKLLMLITFLSAPSAVEWQASQSVVFGAGPLALFDLPEILWVIITNSSFLPLICKTYLIRRFIFGPKFYRGKSPKSCIN